MSVENNILLIDVAEYYSSKIKEYGETAKGVDWNGADSQALRFKQLCKIIEPNKSYDINDLGCGYGAFYDYLSEGEQEFTYSGFDISKEMIARAEKRFRDKKNVRFFVSSKPYNISDYSIASGIFNVKLDSSIEEWMIYIKKTLDLLDGCSRYGFAFNCLTSYSDEDKLKSHLFYANPCMLFEHCKHHYSRNVALLHDYSLYEFTILVRKNYE